MSYPHRIDANPRKAPTSRLCRIRAWIRDSVKRGLIVRVGTRRTIPNDALRHFYVQSLNFSRICIVGPTYDGLLSRQLTHQSLSSQARLRFRRMMVSFELVAPSPDSSLSLRLLVNMLWKLL